MKTCKSIHLLAGASILFTVLAHAQPNILVIVPDDQRWDATSYMQERIESLGRTARFPWIIGHTPGMDRLSEEGIHFDNAFAVYSLCSPSRATMLTGLYPHLNGIVDNEQPFPTNSVTYATILRDAGYATGYFGKWHMRKQLERPGFDEVATYLGQGNYTNNTFYVNGSPVVETNWVDDVSTDYLLSFIDAQVASNQQFVAFLGFKSPHSPRIPPARSANLFSNEVPVFVPNIVVDPPFFPGSNDGLDTEDTRNYMRTLAGIDTNIVRILDRLDTLNIASNTAVIYISDNGYFRGEHGLGDKRAAYEESLRLPFMIRYPALQTGTGTVDKIVLNLDIAPTIVDLAGLPVPDSMQGESLVPLVAGSSPTNWRNSFFFTYNRDPEFPDKIPSIIALRNDQGHKLIRYAPTNDWDEFYMASTNSDPYELTNLIASPAHAGLVASMATQLSEVAAEFDFLRLEGAQKGLRPEMNVQFADGYPFKIESSGDLQTWTEVAGSDLEGGGVVTTLDLFDLMAGVPASWSTSVVGHVDDYVITEGPPVAAVAGFGTLRAGSRPTGDVGGKNAVLIFELPSAPTNSELAFAQLEVTAYREFGRFDADLWALAITNNTAPILRFFEGNHDDPASVKLQEAFADYTLPNGAANETNVVSSLTCGLSRYLRDFYNATPGYSGGEYVFLRLNASWDTEETFRGYLISSAENPNSSEWPLLHLSFQPAAVPSQQFFRPAFGEPASP